MLVLTRHVNEVIVIGNSAEISVKVLGVTGNQIRLGVSAPEDVTVHRLEIYRRLKENENKSTLTKK